MAMKRTRSEDIVRNKDSLDDLMAKCLLLLCHGGGLEDTKPKTCPPPVHHVFECKTCNRQFSSFQALGGHRASHKRPRLLGEEHKDRNKSQSSGNKPKMHECSICGQEFSMGQALGGHMRRHRANEGLSSNIMNPHLDHAKVPMPMKRSNSITRVNVCSLDLNLTPLENDLKLLFGKMAPKVDLRLMI